MTMEHIEQDALINTPDTGTPPIRDHPVHSFIATPRMDKSLMQKFRSLFMDDHVLGVKMLPADETGLRHIFSITSNAYKDRENETITSKALEDYEASCYPAEGEFHCDNTYLWWHDDAVEMGKIVAVSYIKPFLIEVIEEIPNDPVSKVLFDFAEENGDNAGASHRFGYRDEDRTADGDYLHIFKQESTYLPERDLAANSMTYAGVITPMSTQSDARLNQIFEKATKGAITDVAAKLHGQASERAKLLSELSGLVHKAKPAALMDEAEGLESDAIEEEVKADAPADMGKWVSTLNSIYSLVMELVGSQQGSLETEMALTKSIKALEAERVTSKAHEKTLQQRIEVLEARLNLAPKSVQQDKDKGATPEAIVDAVKAAEDQRKQESVIKDPFWGDLNPLPEYK